MTVKIHVEDGVAYVDAVSVGVTVEITNYDVAVGTHCDADQKPCSRYTVTASDLSRWRAAQAPLASRPFPKEISRTVR